MSNAKLEAVIWDMDGVIADTANYHYLAWKDVLAERDYDLNQETFIRLFGQMPDDIMKGTLGDNVPPEEFDTINTTKQAIFRRRVAGNIRALPGSVALIKALYGHRVKQAIASSATPENIEVVLRGLGVIGYFQVITNGYEVSEGKPSPQIYLLAAEKLGATPSGCVVIEDAIAGVDGAKRAGMKCVAVTNSHPDEKLHKADLIVASLEAVSVADLAGLFDPGHK